MGKKALLVCFIGIRNSVLLELLVWIFSYDRSAVMSFSGTNYWKTWANLISEEAQLHFCLSGWQQGELAGAGLQLWTCPISHVLPSGLPWHGPCAQGSRGGGIGRPAFTGWAWQQLLHSPRHPHPVALSTAASAQGQRQRMGSFYSGELFITSGTSLTTPPSRRLSLSKAWLPIQFILSYQNEPQNSWVKLTSLGVTQRMKLIRIRKPILLPDE